MLLNDDFEQEDEEVEFSPPIKVITNPYKTLLSDLEPIIAELDNSLVDECSIIKEISIYSKINSDKS